LPDRGSPPWQTVSGLVLAGIALALISSIRSGTALLAGAAIGGAGVIMLSLGWVRREDTRALRDLISHADRNLFLLTVVGAAGVWIGILKQVRVLFFTPAYVFVVAAFTLLIVRTRARRG